MTAKEAISQLQERIDLINKDYFDLQLDKYAEALEMAIEALNNHLADPGKKVSSSCGQENDPVSRKAAIDAIDDYLDEYSGLDEEGYHGEKWCAMAEAKMVIENLPSAQPEIVRCKDCKYADDDGVCQNSIGLVIQDDDDFCSRAERRTE